MKKTKLKICFVASSGGHWEELLRLKDISVGHDAVYVTERGEQSRTSELNNVYVVPKINRHEKGFLVHFWKLFLEAKKILKQEKPDVVITTGALIAFPFCVIAKLRKRKIVYIESFARVHDKSLTGKWVYPIADLFLVQWEEMLKCYPKGKYVGGIF